MSSRPSAPAIRAIVMAASVLAFALAGFAAPEPPAWDLASDTWTATDALGREVPDVTVCGAPRSDRVVGIFYFLWLQGTSPVYDNSVLLARDPRHPAYGPPNAFHFWGRPLFGYYRSDDEWVIRKHAQMLSDAGVDVVIFDVTNGLTYDDTYRAVCRVYAEMRRQGQRTPQIAFFAHARSEQVVRTLNQEFYSKSLYPELWFRWQGKPLLLAPLTGLAPSITNSFTVRESWAWTDPHGWFGDGHDRWPWLDHSPQQPGWHERPSVPEEISVAVAEHPVANIGRSFHHGAQPTGAYLATDRGLYFGEQWLRALQVQPEFVFVTGWNEWVAQRFLSKGATSMAGRKLPVGDSYFVDEYNQEFSRDIEPMAGGHSDNYYYQLVNFIRRYKGVRAIPTVASRPIQIDGQFDDWKEVSPEFRDTIGDTAHRNHPGWQGEKPFVNNTGRNDIVAAKTSADADRIYFYVRTRDAISLCTDPNWMLLFLDSDHNGHTGWLGYDYVLNRSNVRPGITTLERHVAGAYNWEKVADVEYRVAGNELELAIPRSALNLPAGPMTIDFKWADNIRQTGEASDFTLNGDVAPNDRFNYRARF